MFDNPMIVLALAAVPAVPLGLFALVKWRESSALARLRAVHKAYTLKQMAESERRRVW